MANTEILKALRLVRAAEDAVTAALNGSALKQPQRDVLDALSDVLRNLDSVLLTADLKDSIDELEEESGKLTELNKKAQESLGKLKKLAGAVDDVAIGIGALVQAFKTLANAGLV